MIIPHKDKIEKSVNELFNKDKYGTSHRDFEFNVNVISQNEVELTVSQMYKFVDASLENLIALAELFETKNINMNNWSSNGCDTCDYGSCYSITFTITPDERPKKKE
jgi:hypothetical protein